MGKEFDKIFSEPNQFNNDCMHISRKKYDRDQAALEISREIGGIVEPEDLKKKWVRYQFADESFRMEFDVTHAWMEVIESKNAQPTWAYSAA